MKAINALTLPIWVGVIVVFCGCATKALQTDRVPEEPSVAIADVPREPSIEILSIERTRYPQRLVSLGYPNNGGFLPDMQVSELKPADNGVFLIMTYEIHNPAHLNIRPWLDVVLVDNMQKHYQGIPRDSGDASWLIGIRTESSDVIKSGKLLFTVPAPVVQELKVLFRNRIVVPLPNP